MKTFKLDNWLPTTKKEVEARGWDYLDVILFSGDAYVDHPSFGAAVIGRVLEAEGLRVAIVPQPDWRGDYRDFKKLGVPRLFFGVSAGAMDSMINHYTANKRLRSDDAYTPGGKAGKRPDRATIVYCNKIREAYSKMPIAIGGIEASLRRFAHYDYWDDKVRRSILVDSGADLLMFGMGERSVVEIADAMDAGIHIKDITYVPGTCYLTHSLEEVADVEEIPSFETVCTDKDAYGRAFLRQQQETDGIRGKRLAQKHGASYVVVNPPSAPLNTREMDEVYALPYTRKPHPSYTQHIPAIDEVSFSITSCRGCFGACSFCALTYHQGRTIKVRSHVGRSRGHYASGRV